MTDKDVIKIISDYLEPFIDVSGTRYTYCQMIGLVHRETFSITFPQLRGGKTIEQIFTNFKGDRGHGHSPFQIDDRSHKKFIDSGDWKDLKKACFYAVSVLDTMRLDLERRGWNGKLIGEKTFTRSIFAAYNCGAGNVNKSLKKNCFNPDIYTYSGDYSERVFHYAKICNEIQRARAVEGKNIESNKEAKKGI